jgi:hypothetical protein
MLQATFLKRKMKWMVYRFNRLRYDFDRLFSKEQKKFKGMKRTDDHYNFELFKKLYSKCNGPPPNKLRMIYISSGPHYGTKDYDNVIDYMTADFVNEYNRVSKRVPFRGRDISNIRNHGVMHVSFQNFYFEGTEQVDYVTMNWFIRSLSLMLHSSVFLFHGVNTLNQYTLCSDGSRPNYFLHTNRMARTDVFKKIDSYFTSLALSPLNLMLHR